MPLLTKSLFTTSLGCPRKLYYATHPDLYDNASVDDDFLRSLADPPGSRAMQTQIKPLFFEWLYLRLYPRSPAVEALSEADCKSAQ